MPPSNSAIVISQLYGGGGNSGATYQNDYVELFNRGGVGRGPDRLVVAVRIGHRQRLGLHKQPLGGTIAPGEYYLISLARAGPNGAPLPRGEHQRRQINMSGTSGKIALVDNFDALAGNCPLGDPHLMDLVGYGTANCREGTATAPPSPSNTTAIFRQGRRATDTDQNGNDFTTGAAEATAHRADRRTRTLRAARRIRSTNGTECAARCHDPGHVHRAGRRGRHRGSRSPAPPPARTTAPR